jgi:hypothetical protein
MQVCVWLYSYVDCLDDENLMNLKNIKSALKRQKDKDYMEDTRMYFTLMYWCLEGYGFNLYILVPFHTFRSSKNLTLATLHAIRSLTCLLIIVHVHT